LSYLFVSEVKVAQHEMRALPAELKEEVASLQKARDWAEALLSQYSDLYDFSCVSFLTLDRDGTVLEITPSGGALIQGDRKDVLGRRFRKFVRQMSRPAFDNFLSDLFKNNKTAVTEIRLLSPDNRELVVSLEGKVSNNGLECRAVMIDITEHRRIEEELRFLTIYDPLTGLHNRSFFQEEMRRLEKSRQFPISIMMADLDNLKVTNDLQGHATGDSLLVRVGKVLKNSFRAEDIIARIGGDEFAVILPGSNAVNAKEAEKRVRRAISADNIKHENAPISISLGFSTSEKRMSLAELLNDADRKMYQAKLLVKSTGGLKPVAVLKRRGK